MIGIGGGSTRARGRGDHRGLRPPWSTLLGLLAAAALLGLIAGPSPQDRWWIGFPGFEGLAGPLAVIMVSLAAVGLVLIVIGIITAPKSDGPRERTRNPLPALLAFIVILLLALSPRDREAADQSEEPTVSVGGNIPEPEQPGNLIEVGGGTAALLVLMVLAAAGLLWWTGRPRAEPDDEVMATPDEPDNDRVGAAVDRAAEQLMEVTDARSAVLVAYRQLEQTLEEVGLPRTATETPREHLSRVVESGAVGLRPADFEPGDGDRARLEPLLELADLYSRARFSEHPITPAEQQAAGLALQQSRSRLDPGSEQWEGR